MRKLFAIVLLILLPFFSLTAQEITVRSVEEQTTVLRARTAPAYDNNGDLCALIEVAAPSIEGLEFDKDRSVGAVVFSKGVYSLHIPAGTKKLGFRHDDYLPGTIDFAAAGITITGGSTYSVILEKPEAQSAAPRQFVVFNVSPENAVIELDGEMLQVSEGYAQKLVRFGTHHYRVSSPGLPTQEGDVLVNSATDKAEVNISLVPSVGQIIVGRQDNASIVGATIFLDDELIDGSAPCTISDVSVGEHRLRLVKPLFSSFSADVNVVASASIIVNPVLESSSASVRVVAPDGCEINVNGQHVSSSVWESEVPAGSYIFEVVKEGRVLSSRVMDITSSSILQEIALDVAGGMLIIESSTPGASILLDGNAVGETPLYLTDVFPGSHMVSVSKEGYEDISITVAVTSGNETEVSVPLVKAVEPLRNTVREKDADIQSAVQAMKQDVSHPVKNVQNRGTFFIGGGVGMNYLKTYQRPDLSVDFIAGYAKKYGGYVHISPPFLTELFTYGDFEADIYKISVAAGLATNLVQDRLYLLTGIGCFYREYQVNSFSELGMCYYFDDTATVSVDMGCLVRYGHMGFYFGAVVPTKLQYSYVHAGISILF